MTAHIARENAVDSLVVADAGEVRLRRSLARTDTLDYGYEGCDAVYLAWHGNRVVVASRERLSTYVRVVDPVGGSEEGLSIPWAWVIVEEMLVWVGGEPGLLYTAALPSLDARTPIPYYGAPASAYVTLAVRGSQVEVRADARTELVDLPGPGVRSLDATARELFPCGATWEQRLVLEALAYPFVRGPFWRWGWEPSPIWMPAYWHRYRPESGMRALLEGLGEGRGTDAAARHVRMQAPVVARVCRDGKLPAGWWCLLFDPAPRSQVAGSRVNAERYPPVLREAFRELAAAGTVRLTG